MVLPNLTKKELIGIIVVFLLTPVLAIEVFFLKERQEIRKLAEETPASSDQADFSYIHPLAINEPVYSFSIDGNISLNKEKSFLRVILVDNNNSEYLVYETFSLLANEKSFSISDACEETCLLGAVVPAYLRIEGNSASFIINKNSFTENLSDLKPQIAASNITAERKEIKKEKDRLKIEQLNKRLKEKGLRWIAGETSVSKMTYTEKKRLYETNNSKPVEILPDLAGFEYYKGGIFETSSDSESPSQEKVMGSSTFRSSWDWRTVHGENWNTPVRNQGGAGTCSNFSTVGAMESLINLYYNQHLDIDLSEQMLVDCKDEGERPLGLVLGAYPECRCNFENGGYIAPYYCIFSIHGMPDESCDPYVGREYPDGPVTESYCNSNYVCQNWQSRVWKNTGYKEFFYQSLPIVESCTNIYINQSEEDFKKALIQYGPMDSGLINSNVGIQGHGIVLEGFETDPQDGKTVWIFKNSWGADFGEGGYVKVKATLAEIGSASAPIGPIVPPPGQSYQIACVDKDNDGYCNWGISSNKPDTCSASCKPEKDCDDSNPNLGSFDANFNCNLSVPTPTILPNCPWDLIKTGTSNGKVDQMDLYELNRCYNPLGSVDTGPTGCEAADLSSTKDVVNALDYSILLTHWGNCPTN